MRFCQIFGFSKLLTRGENGSQKGITRQEVVSQISLPNRNLASNIITEQKFGSQI